MKKILEVLSATNKIAIGGHVRPDGDCIGSCMALYLYLKKTMPKAQIDVYLEEPSSVFRMIDGIEAVRSDCTRDEHYDVFIAVDTTDDRLGGAQKYFAAADKTINIDHHISNASGCGMINYVKPDASSASELVYELLDEEQIDCEIAKAIYIGMVHDTGVFQYSNTTPHTLEVAAKLLGYGFDFNRIINSTFYEKTYVQHQVLGRALLESILFMEGRCIVSAVDKKMMDFYNVVPKDLDGIVSQLRLTTGVECAIFMYQTGPQEYKISLRSSEKVDVAQIASYFGGGGHVRAAGCTMRGTYHDCINNLSMYIAKQLDEKEE